LEEEEKCESEHQSLKRPRDESFRSKYPQGDDDFSSIIVDDLGSCPPSNPKIVHPQVMYINTTSGGFNESQPSSEKSSVSKSEMSESPSQLD